MKQFNRLLKIIIVVFMLFQVTNISVFAADSNLDNIKIDASNYNQYREQLELKQNGDNIIDRTTYKDYSFGKYAKTHIDGWNVEILSTEVGADGVHTIKFKADDGYVLPTQNLTADTRFVKSSTFGITNKSYVIENNVGIVKYKPDMNRFNKVTNYVAPVAVVIRLVAIQDGVDENTYLSNYSFVEVVHQGIDFNNTEGYTGISPVVDGSRTYLVKKGAPLIVYYMNQEHHKPIETQPSTTGVSYTHDDYRNRYMVITDTKNDTMNKTLAYETTIFNYFVYSYTQKQWIRLDSYDFYHADNTVQLPAYDNENIVFPGMRVVGFSVQQLKYKPHMANDPEWEKFSTGLEYTWTTKASDYNVQWTSTGVDGGSDQYRHSSLRHRFGDIYLTPVYQYEYTVRFLDYNGTVLDTQKVLKGEDAIAPGNPTREDYTFEGWDKEYTNVQGDLDVHATYKAIEKPVEPDKTKVKVTFIDHDKAVLKEETLDKGGNATAPTSPQRAGYKFVGWDREFVDVQEDIIVQALYELQDVVVLPEEPGTPNIPNPPVITPTPTPAPNIPIVNEVPVTREGNQENNNQTDIEEPDVPQGNGNTIIDDNQTPQGKLGGAWALMNLICVGLTVIVGIFLILLKHKDEEEKKSEECESEYERVEYRRRRWTKFLSLIVAIVSIVVFILTEDMTLPMQLIDRYTIVMVIIFVIQLLVLIIGRRMKEEENKKIQINEG